MVSALWLSPRSLVMAELYYNTQYHFQMQIPEGWVQIPDADVQAMEQSLAQKTNGERPIWIAAFHRKGSPPWTYPYVLMQAAAGRDGRTSFDSIERRLNAEQEEVKRRFAKNDSKAGSEYEIGPITLDRERKEARFQFRMTVDGLGRVEALSVAHLARDGFVNVNGYAIEREFADLSSVLAVMNGSFRFDYGFEFTPGSAQVTFAEETLRGGLLAGLVAGVVAGIYAGLRLRRNRSGRPTVLSGGS